MPLKDPKARRAYENKWARKHPRKRTLRDRKVWRLKYQYGLTISVYNNLLHGQNFKCANQGCGADLVSLPSKQVHVDHDHSTGRIRGILCHHCNWALGIVKDNPLKLQGLISYLNGT